MRIIAGTHKGRVIIAPQNLPVRPTTDFAKEGLFNILNNEINFENTTALDLFCGTGNISYELASRGCAHVTSVDLHANCIKFVQETCKKFQFQNIKAMKANSFLYLKQCSRKFNIIFADPPYANENYNDIPNLVFENNLLEIEGLLIVEHPAEISFGKHPNFYRHKNYGNVNFSFFR